MGRLEERLKRLERHYSAPHEGVEASMALRIHCKAVERYRARAAGKEPPPYTPEEIAGMRESDLETVAGCHEDLRDNPGWQSEEAQAMLDEWEESARKRLAKAENLPPERWHEVWGADDEERRERT